MEAYNAKFAKVWRCIRFLAVIDDPMKSPPPGLDFHQGDIMVEISERQYYDMFNAIPWSWPQVDQ
jgi:hypothetical protein